MNQQTTQSAPAVRHSWFVGESTRLRPTSRPFPPGVAPQQEQTPPADLHATPSADQRRVDLLAACERVSHRRMGPRGRQHYLRSLPLAARMQRLVDGHAHIDEAGRLHQRGGDGRPWTVQPSRDGYARIGRHRVCIRCGRTQSPSEPEWPFQRCGHGDVCPAGCCRQSFYDCVARHDQLYIVYAPASDMIKFGITHSVYRDRRLREHARAGFTDRLRVVSDWPTYGTARELENHLADTIAVLPDRPGSTGPRTEQVTAATLPITVLTSQIDQWMLNRESPATRTSRT